jgi:hypothetical protein
MSFGNKPVQTCRRRARREAVMLAGSALAITRSRSVVVADLSFSGARLGGRDLPGPREDVLMVVGSSERMGTVMWRSGDKCGISFDQPLRAEHIERMKHEGAWAEVTGWAS